MDELKSLRRELGRGGHGRGKRYSAQIKERVVLWAQRRRASGASWEDVGRELGLGLDTVRRWCMAEPEFEQPTKAFVPVSIVAPSSASSGERGVSVCGWRVDGLTLAEITAILRELG